MQHHKYSLTELEGMIPWERDLYLGLLIKFVREETEKAKLKQAEIQAKQRTGR